MHTAVGQFCVQVWRRVVIVVVAVCRFHFGLDYLLVMVWTISSALVWCTILGERCATICLAIYPMVFFWNDYLSRLRCLEGGFGLWLGDNSDIVYGKMSTF